jgi:hypothetical protein
VGAFIPFKKVNSFGTLTPFIQVQLDSSNRIG